MPDAATDFTPLVVAVVGLIASAAVLVGLAWAWIWRDLRRAEERNRPG